MLLGEFFELMSRNHAFGFGAYVHQYIGTRNFGDRSDTNFTPARGLQVGRLLEEFIHRMRGFSLAALVRRSGRCPDDTLGWLSQMNILQVKMWRL